MRAFVVLREEITPQGIHTRRQSALGTIRQTTLSTEALDKLNSLTFHLFHSYIWLELALALHPFTTATTVGLAS